MEALPGPVSHRRALLPGAATAAPEPLWHHEQKIVALSEIHGVERVARAIEDACQFQAFSCEYIANLLESRARALPEPAALYLTRPQNPPDLDLPEPVLALYDRNPATD